MGTEGACDAVALEGVLATQYKKILVMAHELLEAPLSLTKLHHAVAALALNKVPSKDGTLVEFYLLVWEHVGPILLEIMKVGIDAKSLHP